jgi:hypothetical protein
MSGVYKKWKIVYFFDMHNNFYEVLCVLKFCFMLLGRRTPFTWYPQAYVDELPLTDMNMRACENKSVIDSLLNTESDRMY